MLEKGKKLLTGLKLQNNNIIVMFVKVAQTMLKSFF